jgi:hypothetical protein
LSEAATHADHLRRPVRTNLTHGFRGIYDSTEASPPCLAAVVAPAAFGFWALVGYVTWVLVCMFVLKAQLRPVQGLHGVLDVLSFHHARGCWLVDVDLDWRQNQSVHQGFGILEPKTLKRGYSGFEKAPNIVENGALPPLSLRHDHPDALKQAGSLDTPPGTIVIERKHPGSDQLL